MLVWTLSYLRNMYEEYTQSGMNTEKACLDDQRNGETFARETAGSKQTMLLLLLQDERKDQGREKLFKTRKEWF